MGPRFLVTLADVFAGAGGGIVFWNWRRLAHERYLRRTGVMAQGTVVKVVPSSLRINRVRQWHVVYRYQDQMGRTHEARSRALSPNDAHTWHPGDSGAVRFDRTNPHDSLWVAPASIGHARDANGGGEALPGTPR